MSKKLKKNAEIGEIVTVGNSNIQFYWNGFAWAKVKPTVEGMQFFTGEFPPEGSGTSSIVRGSTWYNTENASTYIYMELENNTFGWVINGSPGPEGAQGVAGSSIQKLSDNEILTLLPEAGDIVYDITNNTLIMYNGSAWISITNNNNNNNNNNGPQST